MLTPYELYLFNQHDLPTFMKVYYEYLPQLLKFTLALYKTKDAAEDATNEAFMKLWMCTQKFDSEHNIKSYLFAIARNSCNDKSRKYKLYKKLQRSLGQEKDHETSLAFRSREKTEAIHRMYKAIQLLDPRQRQVIDFTLQGKSKSEIAEAMNISEKTVSRLKIAAHQTLKQLLGKLMTIIAMALVVVTITGRG